MFGLDAIFGQILAQLQTLFQELISGGLADLLSGLFGGLLG